jgi:hypothetical protein
MTHPVPLSPTFLTVEEIDEVWTNLNSSGQQWLVHFGYIQFAQAIERKIADKILATGERLSCTTAQLPPTDGFPYG